MLEKVPIERDLWIDRNKVSVIEVHKSPYGGSFISIVVDAQWIGFDKEDFDIVYSWIRKEANENN